MKSILLSDIMQENAAKAGKKEALRIKSPDTGTWFSFSWEEVSQRVMSSAWAIAAFGIREQDRVGIFSQNTGEWVFIDFACFCNRAIAVPMYATSSVTQIDYIVNDSEISLLFVGDQYQYGIAMEVMKNNKFLKKLVVFDKNVKRYANDKTSVFFDEFISGGNIPDEVKLIVSKRISESDESDIRNIVYTSGTTGEPKGVIIKESNYQEVIRIHSELFSFLPEHLVSVSFLPFTHIFEKAWAIFCIFKRYTIAINSNPKEVGETLKEIRPDAMCSVPRFWEKFYAEVNSRIGSSNIVIRFIVHKALKTSREYITNYKNKGQKPPLWMKGELEIYRKSIFRILKKEAGLENGVFFPCGGAALSDNISIFLQSIDIPIIYGYGLTETSATVSCYTMDQKTVGSVGKVVPDLQIRIEGENNEIQVKGRTVTEGYYKKREATKAAFTEDGWFRTGDSGELTENSILKLRERIKDLYKTSNGKYIAPQQLESRLIEDKYVEMVEVIGNKRKFVSALIVPSFSEIAQYAKKHRIPFENKEDLCNNKLINTLLRFRIDSIQNQFASYEQIKKFTLLPSPFTIENGELTNTLKMKRDFIEKKYKSVIDKMYEE